MVKISPTQLEFLRKIRNQESIPRTISNPTAKALAAKGVLKYQMMVGWALTPMGAVVIGQYRDQLDELDANL